MSAVTTARPRLSRRSLERQGMTPEQELELLIAEQQADDTYFVDRPSHVVSLDAPAPTGEGTIGDLISVDEDGEVRALFPLPATPPLSNVDQHGTIYAYRRLGCKCVKCKAAQAAAVKAYRDRKKEQS